MMECVERLTLNPAVAIVDVSAARFQIRGSGQSFTVADETGCLRALLRAFRDPQMRAEVEERFAPILPASFGSLREWVDGLVLRGILLPPAPHVKDQLENALGYVRSLRLSSGDYVYNTTAQPSVSIVGTGLLADTTTALLSKSGIDTLESTVDSSAILLCCCDWNDLGKLKSVNRVSFDRKCIFLPAVITDSGVRVGPLTLPGETSCIECYSAREMGQFMFPDESIAASGGVDLDRLYANPPNVLASIGAGMIAAQIFKLRLGLDDLALLGQVIYFDALSMRIEYSHVLRMPRCPGCGASNQDYTPGIINGGL